MKESEESTILASANAGAEGVGAAEGDGSISEMLKQLATATGVDFSAMEQAHRTFMSGAVNAVQESSFYLSLADIFESLSREYVAGKIRAVESWADGETSFRLLAKSWPSIVDKLYRINIEENPNAGSPPSVRSISDMVAKSQPAQDRWVTPDLAHEVADDLVRTKFVVPFADGVIDVSERVQAAIAAAGIESFKRYHAKDSGYHARHHYAVLSVPGFGGGGEARIAVEVKILTKMQDTLSELTHLLYEKKRTGRIPAEQKRKLAWQFDSPDFIASYVGHSGHYIEASMVGLKTMIHDPKDR